MLSKKRKNIREVAIPIKKQEAYRDRVAQQCFANIAASLSAYLALTSLKWVTGYHQIETIGGGVVLFAPLVIEGVLAGMYFGGADLKSRSYKVVQSLFYNSDKMTQVVTLTVFCAFCATGSPFWGWVGLGIVREAMILASNILSSIPDDPNSKFWTSPALQSAMNNYLGGHRITS